MCSKNPCGKKKIEYQKVVIPRGMINPHETTVIEIPINLQKQPVVVAKRKAAEQTVPAAHSRSRSSNKYESFRPKHTSSPTNVYNSQSRSHAHAGGMEGFKNNGDLEATERLEREQLQRDLDEFQRARRKLLASTSHLVNADEKSTAGSRSGRKYY